MYDADGERLKVVTLDSTKLCFPASYAPGIHSSDVQEQIYIPATIVKERIPNYTASHVNSYGWDYEHDLRGTAYALSVVDKPTPEEQQAWNVRTQSSDVLIEPDPDFPLYRILRSVERRSTWEFVESSPPENPVGEPPENWYVGPCLEMAGTYDCVQSAEYMSVAYFYSVSRENLHLRHEVREAVIDLLANWHENCAW